MNPDLEVKSNGSAVSIAAIVESEYGPHRLPHLGDSPLQVLPG